MIIRDDGKIEIFMTDLTTETQARLVEEYGFSIHDSDILRMMRIKPLCTIEPIRDRVES